MLCVISFKCWLVKFWIGFKWCWFMNLYGLLVLVNYVFLSKCKRFIFLCVSGLERIFWRMWFFMWGLFMGVLFFYLFVMVLWGSLILMGFLLVVLFWILKSLLLLLILLKLRRFVIGLLIFFLNFFFFWYLICFWLCKFLFFFKKYVLDLFGFI